MNIKLNKNQLNILENKNKLHAFVSGFLTKAYFKLDKDEFTFVLRGSNGMLKTSIPLEGVDVSKTIYYSVPYVKWVNALQKFNAFEEIEISFNASIMKLSSPYTSDVINLCITSYEADSSEANAIDTLVENKSKEIKGADKSFELEPILLSNFQFADSLFNSQASVNSIGLDKNSVVYSDKCTILKAFLRNTDGTEVHPFEDSLFESVDNEDKHIYVHTKFLKLFNLVNSFNTTVYVSDDYNMIYWEDSDTKIVLVSEIPNVNLPSDETFEEIKPKSMDSYIICSVENFLNGVNFFDGFYEGEAWKPITFTITKDDVTLSYAHPTAELKKSLCAIDFEGKGTFILPSEVLKSVLIKIKDRFGDPNTRIALYYDSESLGAYFEVKDINNVGNCYEVLISFLDD